MAALHWAPALNRTSDRLATGTARLGAWLSRLPAVLVVIGCVGVWPAATLAVRLISDSNDFYGVPFALAAVVLAAWVAGLAASLAVTVASVALLAAVLPSMRMLDVRAESTWHLLTFCLVALLVSMLQSADRRLKQHLNAQIEAKDEFLSMMSHELRTPLTIIHGNAHFLANRASRLEDDERRELIEAIDWESERLKHIVEDLLTLGQAGSASKLRMWPVDINAVVAAAIDDFHAHYPRRAVERESATAAAPCLALANGTFLRAVLRNLLTNAHQYSPQEAPIAVSCRAVAGAVQVCVRDYGPGVDQSQLAAIFEPYYRSPALPAGTRGIGMGLTLCRWAVLAMGGRIWAAAAPGGGLQVTFEVPALDPDSEAAARAGA